MDHHISFTINTSPFESPKTYSNLRVVSFFKDKGEND